MAIDLQHRRFQLETESEAYEFLEQLRWGDDGPTECPHCQSTKGAWFLKPKDPAGRRSKGGSSARSQRRVWKCSENNCRRQFSVLTNTVMHTTKMPVRAWVDTIFDLCENPHGTSARDIAARWNLTPKSAWAMLERIERALAHATGDGLFGAVAPRWIELDDESDPVVIDLRDGALGAADEASDSPPQVGEDARSEVSDSGVSVSSERSVSSVEAGFVSDADMSARPAESDPGDSSASSISTAADRVRSDVEQLLAEAFAGSSIPLGDLLAEAEVEPERPPAARRKRRRRPGSEASAPAAVDRPSEGRETRSEKRDGAGRRQTGSKADRPARKEPASGPRPAVDSLGTGWLDAGSEGAATDVDRAAWTARSEAHESDVGLGPRWADPEVTTKTEDDTAR